jgi:opacity protein-like surface antigen
MNKTLAAALLCAVAATPVFAQSQGHWYGALDSGTLTMKNSSFPDPNTMSVAGGYRFGPNLAAEGSVLFVSDSTRTDASGTVNARQGGLQLAAIGFVPLSPSFELFGKAGLGFHTVKMTDSTGAYDPYTTTNIIVGAGAQVNFSSRFSMRLQYESLGKAKSSATDTGADISRLSVGALLNF